MHVLDLLFPKRCIGCKKIGRYLCAGCTSTLPYLEYQICPVCMNPAIGGKTHPKCMTKQSMDGCFALSHFSGVMRKAIHDIKYKSVHDMSFCLTQIVVSHIPISFPVPDIIVPVPLYISRERKRGFNQSKILAQCVGSMLKRKSYDVLIRTRDTKPQFDLHKDERQKNVLGAFACRDKQQILGKSIVLVDDVATTFSTLRECTKMLKRSGASSVWGLVLAHG